ncbi:MAG: phosphotransferase [Acidimicrobiales bacterium]
MTGGWVEDAAASGEEITLRGGSMTPGVVRSGDTVRRPVGKWAPAVHAVLRHLEGAGFEGAPRVIGIDGDHEVLTFIEGRPGVRPRPPALLQDCGLEGLGRLLRACHDAHRGFVPASDAVWMVGPVAWARGYVVRHGDLVPGNTIWQGDVPVALIDWDFAEPGLPLVDLAHLAWTAVPLRSDGQWREEGFERVPDLRHRLHVVCEAYGRFSPREVLDALVGLHRAMSERTIRLGAAGIEPFRTLLQRRDPQVGEEQRLWLERNRGWLGSES